MAKDKFDEFNLNSNEFETDERFIVTISSESDFEDVDDESKNPTKQSSDKNLKKYLKISSLENISSDEVELTSSENTSKWYTLSLKLPFEVIQQMESYSKANRISDPKEIILDTILKNVEPFQFIPYLFSEYKGFYNFHVFDCEDALNKIVSLDYKCTSKDIPNLNFKLKISPCDFNQQKPNINFLLKKILKKRMDWENKSLDLSSFSKDKCIKNTFYMPLWYVGNQTVISSRIAKIINPSLIHDLDVSYNSIFDFEGFNMAITFGNIKVLNLSHNQISHIKELVPFRGLSIRKLFLEFNPICHNYIIRQEYISSVKLIFPTIKILDTHEVSENTLPKSIRNFTVDIRSTPLIDKFMMIYFTLFDSEERSSMMDLYTRNAVFSLSCLKTDLTFHKRSRNLLDSNTANIYIGPRSIIGYLCWIPPTEHIPLSFCVDVLHYTEKFATVSMTGMFVLMPSFHNVKNYHFTRLFTLVHDGEEYKISNDMLNIRSIPLKDIPVELQPDMKKENQLSLTPTEDLTENTKDDLVNMFVRLTKLNKRDALHCLASTKWNFRDATEAAIRILRNN
ncbi:nuclear RNA export factor 1-like [Arctopsyche grandis]|uniref:nuclear RNA export factor 1-like n=1 Tax=Arctopsyche grandis TaxID=121162 RepID=UPI00406D9B32